MSVRRDIDTVSFVGSNAFVRTPQLDTNRLEAAKVIVDISCDSGAMAASDKYLLYCPDGHLRLVNYQGKEKSITKREFYVQDICWSSYKQQFLILERDNWLYSFNSKTRLSRPIHRFQKETYSVTCHGNRLLALTEDTIEEYDVQEWKLVKDFLVTQFIRRIEFDSSGTYLGIILWENASENSRFQLRYSLDMTLLRDISLGESSANLRSLPNRQFLIGLPKKYELCVFDPHDLSKQDIRFEKVICSMALLGNAKRLIIQTDNPEKLYFYGLKDKSRKT